MGYYTKVLDASVYAQKPFNLKILKQDVDKYLDSDVDIQRAKHKVEYLQTTTDFLDRTRQISNRTFTIKNAIECKFTSKRYLMKNIRYLVIDRKDDVYLKIEATRVFVETQRNSLPLRC